MSTIGGTSGVNPLDFSKPIDETSDGFKVFLKEFGVQKINTDGDLRRQYMLSRRYVVLIQTDTGLHAYSVKRSQAKMLKAQYNLGPIYQKKRSLDAMDEKLTIMFLRDVPKGEKVSISGLTLKTYGTGGYGVVDKVRLYSNSNRFPLFMKSVKVAKKKLKKDKQNKGATLAQEKQVAKKILDSTKTLKHVVMPVKVHHGDTEESFVMERAQPFAPCINSMYKEDFCKYFEGIILGLEELYALNILYTDLKTENVLVKDRDHPGHAKICDLGSGILLEGESDSICYTKQYTNKDLLEKLNTHIAEYRKTPSPENKLRLQQAYESYCLYQMGIMLLEGMTSFETISKISKPLITRGAQSPNRTPSGSASNDSGGIDAQNAHCSDLEEAIHNIPSGPRQYNDIQTIIRYCTSGQWTFIEAKQSLRTIYK